MQLTAGASLPPPPSSMTVGMLSPGAHSSDGKSPRLKLKLDQS